MLLLALFLSPLFSLFSCARSCSSAARHYNFIALFGLFLALSCCSLSRLFFLLSDALVHVEYRLLVTRLSLFSSLYDICSCSMYTSAYYTKSRYQMQYARLAMNLPAEKSRVPAMRYFAYTYWLTTAMTS